MTALPDQKKFLKMEKMVFFLKLDLIKIFRKNFVLQEMKFKKNKIKKAFKALHKYDYNKNLKLYLNEIRKSI